MKIDILIENYFTKTRQLVDGQGKIWILDHSIAKEGFIGFCWDLSYDVIQKVAPPICLMWALVGCILSTLLPLLAVLGLRVSFCDLRLMARKRRALNLYWISLPSLILELVPFFFLRMTLLMPSLPTSSETAASYSSLWFSESYSESVSSS